MAIYESENAQPNVNVYPNGGNGGYGDGFGNNGAWWIIILFTSAIPILVQNANLIVAR